MTTGDLAETLFGVVQQFDGRDGLGVEAGLAGFHAGQRQQVLGEARHAGGVLADDLEKFTVGRGTVGAEVEQGFGVSLNRSQRGAEFVRDVGDEVATGLFDPLGLGEVAQDGDGASIRKWSGGDVEGVTRDDGGGASGFDLLGGSGRFDGGEEIGIANRLNDRGVQPGALRDKTIHGLVGPLDEAVGAYGNDGVLHAVQQGFELVLAGADGREAAFDLASGLVDGGGHAANLVEGSVLNAGTQISLLDADCDIHNVLETARGPN